MALATNTKVYDFFQRSFGGCIGGRFCIFYYLVKG